MITIWRMEASEAPIAFRGYYRVVHETRLDDASAKHRSHFCTEGYSFWFVVSDGARLTNKEDRSHSSAVNSRRSRHYENYDLV